MGIEKIVNKVKEEIAVIKGDKTKDKFFSSEQTFGDPETAQQALIRAKEKLFHVNDWSKLPGISSKFRVYDADGAIASDGVASVGKFIFINLPGPTPETWVHIIDIKDDESSAEFTVRPSHDPREKDEKQQEVEHFFADEATSTFKVKMIGNTLYAYEIGKEEGINNKGKEAGGHQVINTLIAVGGWILFQEIQWRKLTEYLVHIIEAEE